MSKIKKIVNEEKGSILILTMLALVSAISIAVAMSSISIVERKITTKSRKSVTAFQSANSGIEWAMKKINDAEPGKKISDLFNGAIPDSKGQIDCDNASIFSTNSDLKCKITFLKRGVSGTREIITSDAPIEDVVAIRSSGTFGSGTETVGRALEAYAMPNCGNDSIRVADFCIDKEQDANAIPWIGAMTTCGEGGKRLCSASELLMAEDTDLTDVVGDEWVADIAGNDIAAYVSTRPTIQSDSTTAATHNFRCCRNR